MIKDHDETDAETTTSQLSTMMDTNVHITEISYKNCNNVFVLSVYRSKDYNAHHLSFCSRSIVR